jgi:hypothetical protein
VRSQYQVRRPHFAEAADRVGDFAAGAAEHADRMQHLGKLGELLRQPVLERHRVAEQFAGNGHVPLAQLVEWRARRHGVCA